MNSIALLIKWWGRTAAGIPYKVLSREGNAERNKESVTEVILLPSLLLQHFLAESFPPVEIIDGIPTWNNRACPGADGLKTTRVAWKNHIDGKPVDPFLYDPAGTIAGSYHPILEVPIEYSNLEKTTALEIRGSASGEFLHLSAPKGSWQDEIEGSSTPNTEMLPPITMMIPETAWTVSWKSVPLDWFEDKLLPVMRRCLGKVNLTAVAALYDAEPETILFTGYSTTQEWTKAVGTNLPTDEDIASVAPAGLPTIEEGNDQPLVTVEMQFLEKRFADNLTPTKIRGHNHFWQQETGDWRRLLVDGVNGVYRRTEMKDLFNVPV
jgi:hypothetical protein